MPIRNTVIIAIALIISLLCYHEATHNRFAAQLEFAMQIVENNYIEEVSADELFENAMSGMVGNLDEYSAYISQRHFELFSQNIDQQFVGIGVIVQGPPQTRQLQVVTPVYGSPAYRAGLRAGDVILEIDGKPTAHWSVDQAVGQIKGPRGTTVSLTVQHEDAQEPETVVVLRDVIHTRSVLGDTRAAEGEWNFFLAEEPRIGYARITTFGERTAEELKEVLQFKDHPVEAFILDLRGNPGGLLTAALDTCNMFIDEGVIVSIRGRHPENQETYRASPSTTVVDPSLPVVVLVDGFSASASEIVAACLKDHDRAEVAGERTWGKGTVQNVIEMQGGTSALKLTTASYWRPNGKNIHRGRSEPEEGDWGVRPTPGLQVKLDEEQHRELVLQRRRDDILRDETAKSSGSEPPAERVEDPQLQRAIEHLRGRIDDSRVTRLPFATASRAA